MFLILLIIVLRLLWLCLIRNYSRWRRFLILIVISLIRLRYRTHARLYTCIYSSSFCFFRIHSARSYWRTCLRVNRRLNLISLIFRFLLHKLRNTPLICSRLHLRHYWVTTHDRRLWNVNSWRVIRVKVCKLLLKTCTLNFLIQLLH